MPIAWHQRKEESAKIVAAAESAERLLQAAGLTCRIDDGDKFTPGARCVCCDTRQILSFEKMTCHVSHVAVVAGCLSAPFHRA